MFHLTIYYPRLRYSHAKRVETRKASILTHLPTGRKWHFPSKKAGMAALKAFSEAVAGGNMSILPVEPADAPEAAAAA